MAKRHKFSDVETPVATPEVPPTPPASPYSEGITGEWQRYGPPKEKPKQPVLTQEDVAALTTVIMKDRLKDGWHLREDGQWESKGQLHIIEHGQHTYFPPGTVRGTEEAYAMEMGRIS